MTTSPDRDGLLREQGVTLGDIDARLASGYAEFKQPLMVAVADVSALRAALAGISAEYARLSSKEADRQGVPE